MTNTPKVGLALGSGAARGFAHIGVINVLKKNNIEVDFVAGSSIGAVIGALFCSNFSLNEFARLLQHIDIRHLLDFSVSRKSLLRGKKIEDFLKLMVRVKRFEEMHKPLAVVATDLIKGERVVFTKGDVVKAVRASITVPGILEPVYDNGKMLVDGGVIDRVPSSVVKAMGADIVIGVDVGFKPGDRYEPKNIFDIITQSIGVMEMQILKRRIIKCDVLISPDVQHITPYSLDNIVECIKIGEITAQESITKIKALIMQKMALDNAL